MNPTKNKLTTYKHTWVCIKVCKQKGQGVFYNCFHWCSPGCTQPWPTKGMHVSTTASYFQLVQLSLPIPWTGQGWLTINHSNSKGLGLVFFRWVCRCIFASSFRNKYKNIGKLGFPEPFDLQMIIFPFRRHFTPLPRLPVWQNRAHLWKLFSFMSLDMVGPISQTTQTIKRQECLIKSYM